LANRVEAPPPCNGPRFTIPDRRKSRWPANPLSSAINSSNDHFRAPMQWSGCGYWLGWAGDKSTLKRVAVG